MPSFTTIIAFICAIVAIGLLITFTRRGSLRLTRGGNDGLRGSLRLTRGGNDGLRGSLRLTRKDEKKN